MSNPVEQAERLTSQEALCLKKTSRDRCCSTLKRFIVALSFVYFSKALSGSYMKSSITQIERRFELSSSHTGLVDCSFEIGNLLFLVAISYFGAKMHRPRLIAAGCLVMAVGTGLIGLPHFFMERYKFDTVVQSAMNENSSISACVETEKQPSVQETMLIPSLDIDAGCVKNSQSQMWIYMFLGNALRGIGEAPVTPLGISYIDDFARAENSAFYIACLQTITLLGPMVGFVLGSLCARLYVDIGFINTDSITITPTDARWVGAWWLGFLVSSAIMFLAGLPFWFFPRSLPKQGEEHMVPLSPQEKPELPAPCASKLADIAKGFLPSLKKLLGTPAYFLLLCGSLLKSSAYIGLITFKAKYMEQQFGQTAARANFLIGVLNLPAVVMGIFLGGLLMKRYKFSVVSGAQFAFVTGFLAYLLVLPQLGIKCENSQVAGLTISYNGSPGVSYEERTLFSECNAGCSCSVGEWDPVCSENGITYVSPCLAGCTSSSGSKKNMVFHNCSCVMASPPESGNLSVSLGQCTRSPVCSRNFAIYMTVSVLSSFITSLGTTPGYMIIIRCIAPELKSLALGMQTLVMRALGGIPAPVYFGALIDSTCLKWGIKKCGGKGACRIYDSDMYRVIFLGLVTCLIGSSYFFNIAVIVLLRRQAQKDSKAGNPPTNEDGLELHQTQTEKETDKAADQTNGQSRMVDQTNELVSHPLVP